MDMPAFIEQYMSGVAMQYQDCNTQQWIDMGEDTSFRDVIYAMELRVKPGITIGGKFLGSLVTDIDYYGTDQVFYVVQIANKGLTTTMPNTQLNREYLKSCADKKLLYTAQEDAVFVAECLLSVVRDQSQE